MSEHKPGPEFDALIAVKVMGWKGVIVCEIGCCVYSSKTCFPGERRSWSPSTDITAAWEVVEKMIEQNYVVSLTGLTDYNCQFEEDFDVADYPSPGPMFGEATAKTAPMAICLAALQAVDAV